MREKQTGKLLADYHLETYLQCPYKFYHRFVAGKKLKEYSWRQVVQNLVNLIVHQYYSLPPNARSKVAVLRLIQQYWSQIPLHLFQDKAQYYTILAKLTDHLLQALTKKEIDNSPLFLYEQFQTSIEEINVSLKFEVGNWSDRSFTVTKFLVDADDSMAKLYTYLTILFSHTAFGMLPEKVEVITLLDGHHFQYSPAETDVQLAKAYFTELKENIRKPQEYTHIVSPQNCSHCVYEVECNFKNEVRDDQKTGYFH
ncbi:PD-(D/E)XK nuclease family protein [Mesobacillus subterraneus]|uniref:PD-(D/E)XK nuclease family protein n=1 Tax=Mesobacillus subterraneus TaxID=285983 RepID=UPI001CFEA2D3|nr:PD-(D/E)XK nuclease family protein [Mesobacillus subterraneus]